MYFGVGSHPSGAHTETHPAADRCRTRIAAQSSQYYHTGSSFVTVPFIAFFPATFNAPGPPLAAAVSGALPLVFF